LGVPADGPAVPPAQLGADPLPGAGATPSFVVVVDGRPGRELVRRCAPLADRAQEVERRVGDPPRLEHPRMARLPAGNEERREDRPLLVAGRRDTPGAAFGQHGERPNPAQPSPHQRALKLLNSLSAMPDKCSCGPASDVARGPALLRNHARSMPAANSTAGSPSWASRARPPSCARPRATDVHSVSSAPTCAARAWHSRFNASGACREVRCAMAQEARNSHWTRLAQVGIGS
jgi:hypothetical protein